MEILRSEYKGQSKRQQILLEEQIAVLKQLAGDKAESQGDLISGCFIAYNLPIQLAMHMYIPESTIFKMYSRTD